jgi:hypothetical protein
MATPDPTEYLSWKLVWSYLLLLFSTSNHFHPHLKHNKSYEYPSYKHLSMAESETVYAVHSFEAENDDELTFQIGETVLVIQKDDGFDDGWWKVYIEQNQYNLHKLIFIGAMTPQGQNIRGEVGLFPMNYITYDWPTTYPLTKLPTPSFSDSTIRKKPNYIDAASRFEDEGSESPSVRSSYSFTCPITSLANGPLSIMSNNSSYSNSALRRSVISTLFLPNLRSTSPEDWDVDQVEIWLNAMNFECVAMNFKGMIAYPTPNSRCG